VQIIFSVSRLGLRSIQRSLRVSNIGLRLTNRCLSPVNVGGGAASCRPGSGNRMHFGPNAPLFVDNLSFERGLVRHPAVKGVLIRPIVDFKK
jgi:hypothetical protein